MTVEQDGPETCEVAGGGGFVRMKIPVRVFGETQKTTPLSCYQVEDFMGRETTWSRLSESRASVTFRIPVMLLQEGARLTLEVFRIDRPTGHETLWTRRYRARWVNGRPEMEPSPG